MRIALLCLLGVAACHRHPDLAQNAPLRAGVAVARPDAVCLDFPGAPLAAGVRLAVLNPGGPDAAAEVVGPAGDGCKPIEKDWGHYQLRVTTGELPLNQPAIAFPAGLKLQPKSCASTEGLHLTLWEGKPLESRRLWHFYFPLGYDVEPNCSPEETKPE